ncbi:NAD-dependent epimerase/dehydratase family protein [Streptococcus saliviloxodontae]|uniref:Nucleoside-diphosphate-sugar epimerase n=1 Tax=Streptococcus saliviloxodontae TaxID=1349416 RepID=A0ABS2PKK6_9STRE|nr:NAD-dependent epimerase/dehydratase family protein [Streptococcus saliviloxodontae]MBM7635970.1 nucleoside-diphosphate-sugar epimerase [Streptococcus saliviloxodontae]
MKKKRIFVTGAAGFIGSNLVMALLASDGVEQIIGLDNLSDYYDVSLKDERLKRINEFSQKLFSDKWVFIKGSLADKSLIDSIFETYQPDVVINLAAQAGVRYSIKNPDAYIEANVLGFYNILEACRHSYDDGKSGVEHLIYASSSSVYGSNANIPYSVEDKVDNPVSLYAATKKSNELFAHAYSKLYGIPSTGLRFFTVYGPAGRPDMAYFGFTDKLVKGETINIFNYGNCQRDFTYIDDIIEGIMRIVFNSSNFEKSSRESSDVPYRVYNIGNSSPENLLDFVTILKEELVTAKVLPEDFELNKHIKLVPMQPGDVEKTFADTSALEKDYGFKPETSLRAGLREFAQWYYQFFMQANLSDSID